MCKFAPLINFLLYSTEIILFDLLSKKIPLSVNTVVFLRDSLLQIKALLICSNCEDSGSHAVLARVSGDQKKLQCRHLIPALNAWVARAKYTTARPIATQFHGHLCVNDLTTERNFDSQITWVINVRSLYLLT